MKGQQMRILLAVFIVGTILVIVMPRPFVILVVTAVLILTAIWAITRRKRATHAGG